MNFLDDSGYSLFYLLPDVKKYLASRKDTIAVILKDLSEEGEFGLDKDIKQCSGTLNDNENDWEPESLEFKGSNRVENIKDSFSLFVYLFESKEIFISNFEKLLAKNLLNADCDVTKERSLVEMLKLKFGENLLRNCDLMIKDIIDSSRLSLQLEESKCSVISWKYWEISHASGHLDLPHSFSEPGKIFKDSYSRQKPGRYIKFLSYVGNVCLSISVGKQKLFFNVIPAHAYVIEKISHLPSSSFSADDISISILTRENIAESIEFWISHGIIRKIDGRFEKILEEDEIGKSKIESISKDVESQPSEKCIENLQVYWSFINGMLTNLGDLPIDRIQNMLCLFVQTPQKYECSMEELKKFLDHLVDEDKLVFKKGVYSLKK